MSWWGAAARVTGATEAQAPTHDLSRRGFLRGFGLRPVERGSGSEEESVDDGRSPRTEAAAPVTPWDDRRAEHPPAAPLAPALPEPTADRLVWVRPPRVDALRCLARTGCAVCVERCPRPGALRIQGIAPRIDPDHCDRCGICVDRCPAPVRCIDLGAV